MTMTVLTRRLGALLVVAALLPTFAAAEPSKDVQSVIDAVGTLFDRAPLRLAFDATVSVPAGGPDMKSTVTGTQLFADPRHMSMDMAMRVETPQGLMTMSIKTVYDGETMWTEMNMPMMGMRNVSRASLDVLDAAGAAAAGAGAASLDPRTMLGRVAEEVDLKVTGRTDGVVTLEGPLDAEASKALELGGAGAAIDMTGAIVRLRFDESSGQPRGMQLVSDGTTMLDLTYRDVEFLGADDVPADAFAYTPPEGVQVTDLDPVLKQQQPAGD